MLEFYAEKFVVMCSTLALIPRRVDIINASEASGDLELDEQLEEALASFDRIEDYVKELHSTLIEMGLTVSAHAASMFLRRDKHEDNKRLAANQNKFLIDHLVMTIHAELRGRIAMMIPFDRIPFYKTDGTFLGKEIIQKFPYLSEDAAEAGNCFALGRYTTSVFHLMRLMERVVQDFGRKMGVELNVEEETWGQILVHGNNAIEKMPTASREEKKKRIQFDACYKLLDGVRTAWRNDIMHPKQDYSAERARDLIGVFKSFVEDFSKLED
jgi:hypothetical protein